MIRSPLGFTRIAGGLSNFLPRLRPTALPTSPSFLNRLFGTSFWRHQVKKRIAILLRIVTDWALFTATVLVVGLSSAYYMMDRGASLTTLSSGPWTKWAMAARADADPYTLAHFARQGSLPLPADLGETWLAHQDSEGDTLHSSCDYDLVWRPPVASWWSLAVFDGEGRLIDNAAGRFAFTSDTAALSPDGRVQVRLSRQAGEGNWLPTSGAGNLTVTFTLVDLSVATGTGETQDDMKTRVPDIIAKSCR